MQLWIGIHLPLLALETFRPCWSEPGLYAVIDHNNVQITSQPAALRGVRHGCRTGIITSGT